MALSEKLEHMASLQGLFVQPYYLSLVCDDVQTPFKSRANIWYPHYAMNKYLLYILFLEILYWLPMAPLWTDSAPSNFHCEICQRPVLNTKHKNSMGTWFDGYWHCWLFESIEEKKRKRELSVKEKTTLHISKTIGNNKKIKVQGTVANLFGHDCKRKNRSRLNRRIAY